MSDAQDAATDTAPSLPGNSSQDAHSSFVQNLTRALPLSPLSLAAKEGDTERVKRLLENPDADVNAVDDDGNTPLTHAAREGHIEIVKMMLEDKNKLNADNYQRAFFAAAAANRWSYHDPVPILELLLATFNIDVNATDENSFTALHLAACNRRTGTVEFLLEIDGIDINKKDKSGLTALGRALAAGNGYVVGLLLPRKDLAWDANLDNSIQQAARSGCHDPLDSLLASGCAPVNNYLNPMSWAVMLLKHGADANAEDCNGRTPLWWAIREKEEEVVKKLIPVDTGTLCTLVLEEDLEKLKSMLRFNPKLEQRGRYGQTALHIAVKNGIFDIAEALMSAGADVDAEDNLGMTPLQSALKDRNIDLVLELLKRRANTTSIMSQEWRQVSDKGDVTLLSKAFDGELHLDFPDVHDDIWKFMRKHPHRESFLL
ncbi:Ankyrin-1 [Trichoderma ghanense]|uniref:Ankyrin-1 n=1 Tax=Trichoderma ghanense TaxID=65468 RepID=A0ABY2HEB7_9HYPO